MIWLIFFFLKLIKMSYSNRFSTFDEDPEYHIEDMDFDKDDNEGDFSDATLSDYIPSPREIEQVEVENALENGIEYIEQADAMISSKDHTNSTMICRVPPQGSYQNGRLMCSICSTLLGLCIASGVMPDPGTIIPMLCIQLIGSIMERSSKLQGEYVDNEMKQISEVLGIIEEEGMMVMIPSTSEEKSKFLIECFGPLCDDHASEQVVSTEEGMKIKGLDKVLEEDLGVNDGIVVTTKGHSVYMMKVVDGMYVFDPLYGSLDKVSGNSKNAYDYMGYGNSKSITGLEEDKMYTGMIMRKFSKPPFKPTISKTPTIPSTIPSPSTIQPIQEPFRATKNKVQIMEEATKVLENMRHDGNGPVVQALRLKTL